MVTEQLNLFDACRKPDPQQARLSRQCDAILERLRRGRATNDELSQISRKYTQYRHRAPEVKP